ncbi:MAG: NAD-binding protein [Myxococcota bacterium]
MIKSATAQLVSIVGGRRGQRNLRSLSRFFMVLVGLIGVYTALFHFLMLREGQTHSWVTGFYWTLTVMSTLGFGDITFHSDPGRAFSILVLLSGMIFLLVLLPFTFIEFFYGPWMRSQEAARAPRELPADIQGHILLTHYDAVTLALIRRLRQFQYQYALVVPDVEEALRLHDEGLEVVVGALDDPEAWQKLRVAQAAIVAATGSDVTNTNVSFTVREVAPEVRIVSTATDQASVDVLELAGSNHVLRLEHMIGGSFARRVVGGDALAHVIGEFDEIRIAEASTHRTPLVGRTLRESNLREKVGVTVVGVWERGRFEPARPETRIHENTILVLAGSAEHLYRYDELFCIYNVANAPVVIVGGGRVGRATAQALREREVDSRIVELVPGRVRDPEQVVVVGNAAELEVLRAAGIDEAPTVIITPHDDDLNVYLTVYCRKLRPDVLILSRATLERNVATLHRAGADIVMSYAFMGATAILNWLKRSRVLMVAEGLDLFRVRVPGELAGKSIAESSIRELTGCSIVAMSTAEGMEVGPSPEKILSADSDIVVIGSIESEDRFLERFGSGTAVDSD